MMDEDHQDKYDISQEICDDDALSESGESTLTEDDSMVDSSQSHERFSELYKYNKKSLESSHEQRRQLNLKYQRENRQKDIDNKRKLDEIIQDIMSAEASKPMDCTPNSTHTKKKKVLRHKLMLSKWMDYLPSDYPENWVAKFCPEGHRNLVVAAKHTTTCFGRKSGIRFKFISALPGGGGADKFRSGKCTTVLDCIYNETLKTFFILDVLVWNGNCLLNCDAVCRNFLLKSRFEELPKLRNEEYHFSLLDHVECDPSLIQERMCNLLQLAGQELLYDGVVFYHKESTYEFRTSLLVRWLKSYMIPELLQINIHPSYNRKIPDGYVNIQQFFEEKDRLRKLQQQKKKQPAKMDFS